MLLHNTSQIVAHLLMIGSGEADMDGSTVESAFQVDDPISAAPARTAVTWTEVDAGVPECLRGRHGFEAFQRHTKSASAIRFEAEHLAVDKHQSRPVFPDAQPSSGHSDTSHRPVFADVWIYWPGAHTRTTTHVASLLNKHSIHYLGWPCYQCHVIFN